MKAKDATRVRALAGRRTRKAPILRIQLMITPLDVRLPQIIMINKNRDCPHLRKGRAPRKTQATQRLVCYFPGGSLPFMKFCMNIQRDEEEAMTIFSSSSLENNSVKDKERIYISKEG